MQFIKVLHDNSEVLHIFEEMFNHEVGLQVLGTSLFGGMGLNPTVATKIKSGQSGRVGIESRTCCTLDQASNQWATGVPPSQVVSRFGLLGYTAPLILLPPCGGQAN